jgi:ABC-type amino acid transport system permease subunit
LADLLKGTLAEHWNMHLSLCSSAPVIGALIALLHLSKNKILSGIAGVYVNVLRGTPSAGADVYLLLFSADGVSGI